MTARESSAMQEAERIDFIEQVMAMVHAIPPGRVMTYGDIAIALTARAERAGLGEVYGPRMVGFVMSRFGSAMPWWRVIRAGGYPPRSLQAEAWPHYVAEGTPLLGDADGYRIDMRLARHDPDDVDPAPMPDPIAAQGHPGTGRRQARPAHAPEDG